MRARSYNRQLTRKTMNVPADELRATERISTIPECMAATSFLDDSLFPGGDNEYLSFAVKPINIYQVTDFIVYV